jgi:large conductance mechanosensitive channel
MWREFKTFLIKQNAIALAIAVVIGVALNGVVQAIVNDLIMPVVGVIIPKGDWQTATVDIGLIHLKLGDLGSALLNFVIIGFVAWWISRSFIKPEPTAASKSCPYCKLAMDPAATRCPHCTSALTT